MTRGTCPGRDSTLNQPGARGIILRLYRQGWTLRRIAEEFFIHHSAIGKALERWGEPRRVRGTPWRGGCVECGKGDRKRCDFHRRVWEAAYKRRRAAR